MYPYKIDTQRRERRGRGNVTKEKETGVRQPQIKECQQPPKGGRGKERCDG